MRSEEKWNFFPSWTGSSFFRPTSTYWELAATAEMRNPPNDIEIATEQELMSIFSECVWGGMGREGIPKEKERKNIFALATDFFSPKEDT